MTATGIDGLDGWVPAEERSEDVVTPAVAAALHGLLDAPGTPPANGDRLPALWHWLAFLPRVPQAQLGPDGHPHKGGFLPPVPLPRRMFVGGDVALAGAGQVHIGAPLLRVGLVEAIEAKSGRSGDLVFVTVGYRVAGGGTAPADSPAIEERQQLVYRPATPPGGAPAGGGPAGAPAGGGQAGGGGPAGGPAADSAGGPDGAEWTMGFDLPIDPTLLFRFSALTYNAHRIHYDRAWATGEEGYPGLVVHGPLQAIGLAELCRRFLPERPVVRFAFRAVQPAFDDGPVALRGRLGDDGRVDLVAFDHRGRPTMTATADLAGD